MSGSQAATSRNGAIKNEEPAGDAGVALVSSLPSSELGTAAVAQRLGRSESWVKRHWQELQGRLVDGRFVFPEVAIERRTTTSTSEKIVLRARTPEPPDLGRRTAAVLERLEVGGQVVRIAIELQETGDFVLKAREQWLRAHAADREGLIFSCRCGAPSDPHCAQCARCAARSRVLTDAEAAVLDGREMPPPETCGCTGCGSVVDMRQAAHVCLACAPQIAVALTGGRLVVVLGSTTLRELTPAETQRLLAPVVASTPAATPLVPVLPPTAPRVPAADGGVLQIRDALEQARAQRIESEKRLSETQARLAALDREEAS